eukprot:6212912-Pleurochrysis_carterae.AAC.3
MCAFAGLSCNVLAKNAQHGASLSCLGASLGNSSKTSKDRHEGVRYEQARFEARAQLRDCRTFAQSLHCYTTPANRRHVGWSIERQTANPYNKTRTLQVKPYAGVAAEISY